MNDSQAVFVQLAGAQGEGGVKTIIENHDSWTHAEPIEAALTVALRARIQWQLDALSHARIARQRETLAHIVTRLPGRLAAAC